MKDFLSRAARKFLDNLHYSGLVVVVFLLVHSQLNAQIAETTLASSVRQQELMRNVLWTNLLTQRAAVIRLSGKVVGDKGADQRARDVANSIQSFVGSDRQGEERDNTLFEKITEIEALFKKSGDDKGLLESVDRIGADLNRIESHEWYDLAEKNKRLLEDLNTRHKETYFTYALFIFYLGLLGWLSSRKNRAEKKLVKTESALLQSAKMSALGEMAGGIAHEINSPLAIIQVTSEQIEELLQEGTEREVLLKMLRRIGETVVRISTIIQGLKTFARDDSSGPLVPVQLKQIIQSTLSLCQEKMKYAGVLIRLGDVPEDVAVRCRSVQISQVLLNLLNNACDAIAPLQDKWISVFAESDPDPRYVRIYVTDSGERISDAIRDKIFQPFFTTKDIGKGTGLGLSISKGIVEAHDGTLSLDPSCENTRFVVRLLKSQHASNQSK